MGKLLDELPVEEQSKCGVVLADEKLLFPILYALPDQNSFAKCNHGIPSETQSLVCFGYSIFRISATP